MSYNDGTEKGKTVRITETWEGNYIPLAKIYKALESGKSLSENNRLEKVKTVRELTESRK